MQQTTLQRISEKKKQWMAGKMRLPAVEKNLYIYAKVALTYASNAIEGNTLTEGETAIILDKGIAIGGKTLQEHLEVVGHARAVDWIQGISTQRTRKELAMEDLLTLHRLLLQEIMPEEAGRFRKVAVRIAGSHVARPNPAKVPILMEQFLDNLQHIEDHEVVVALQAHLDFVFIHPFIDGNGRTARLLFNLLLLQEGYPLVVIDNHKRKEYIDGIEEALLRGNRKEYDLFMFQMVEQALDDSLAAVHDSI
ncbi:MAG: Fic family protein [Chlamydiae bacterium]|nr:Fic family protein [Chlamydiota bacterium]